MKFGAFNFPTDYGINIVELAVALEERAYALRRRYLPPGDPELLFNLQQIVMVLVVDNRCDDAEPYVDQLARLDEQSPLDAVASLQRRRVVMPGAVAPGLPDVTPEAE